MSNPYLDPPRLNALQLMLCCRLDDVLAELGVSLTKTGRMYFGCCPVHGGNNATALNLYRVGETKPGYWRCYTKQCHVSFQPTVIGFVRGVLSHQKCGWTPGDKKNILGWKSTIDWCCGILGTTIADVDVNDAGVEKARFASGVSVLTRPIYQASGGLKRAEVRERLKPPSPYFLDRGWLSTTLDRFDIGTCLDPSKPFFERAVVPVYDQDYKRCVGYTARSIHEKCGACGSYHTPSLPCLTGTQSPKWLNSKGFSRESHLFGYWFAREKIKKSGVVCVCEGPMDVLRLVEARVHVGVALFGLSLSDQQQILLETSGATDVVVLLDNDQAGKGGAGELKKRLCRSFRLHFPKLPSKDLGELPPEEVRQVLEPTLVRLRKAAIQ